ncbi:MAG: GNAT family protein [Nocardioidaceae bacterium]
MVSGASAAPCPCAQEASNRAEIAYGAHPAIRGGGVMTTAVNLLLEYGFEQLGLETIIWWANRGNVPSRRVAWKSGFTFAGTLPGWLDQRGEARDAWVGSLHKTAPRVPSCEWFDIPVIESTRLRLRPLVDADSGRIVEACSDPVTRHWLSLLPHPYTSADAADFVLRTDEMAASGQGISWAIADVSTDELIGNVTLSVQQHNAMVGYWMHPAARGRGLMTEAVAAVARHAFVSKADGGLGIPRVWLKAAAGNVASQRVALACGFVECGRERQSEVTGDGSCHDALVFDLLAADWSRN